MLVAVLALTAASAVYLSQELSFDNSVEIWLKKDSKKLLEYNHLKALKKQKPGETKVKKYIPLLTTAEK